MTNRDLSAIVTPDSARYSERYPRDLLDEMMCTGDPNADDALSLLREDHYATGAGNLESLQRLADGGDEVAAAFFAHAYEVPDWVDWEVMARGQRLGLAHLDLYGMSLLHNLFAGSVFMRATQVIASTGRIGADPTRRIRETSGFVVAVLADEGVRPGSPGHETATRVRLLHASIRKWFTRDFDFETPYSGVPIDQVALAMTLTLFSYQNVRNLLRMGVPLARQDIEGHHLLWRYVGYLLGIDERLLSDSPEQERELWEAIVAHQAFPDLLGPESVERMIEFMVGQMAVPKSAGRRESLARAVLEHLSGPEMLGVDSIGRNVLAEWGLQGIGLSVGAAYRWVPRADDRLVRRGRRIASEALEAGREHDFGVEIEAGESPAEARARYETSLRVVARRYAST